MIALTFNFIEKTNHQINLYFIQLNKWFLPTFPIPTRLCNCLSIMDHWIRVRPVPNPKGSYISIINPTVVEDFCCTVPFTVLEGHFRQLNIILIINFNCGNLTVCFTSPNSRGKPEESVGGKLTRSKPRVLRLV